MSKTQIRFIAIIILIIIIVVALFYWKDWDNSLAKAHGKPGPAVVVFAKAKSASWHDTIPAVGTIASRRGVTLEAEVAGRITHIYANSGQFVKKGTQLYQIYPNTLQAQYEADKANLQLSEFKLQQNKKLYAKNAISELSYMQAKQTAAAKRATMNATLAKLKLTTIHAPFNGLMGLTAVEIGDYVTTGEKLATFQSKHDLRVDFAIPDNQAHEIAIGQTVTLDLAGKNREITGKVYALNPKIESGNRMMDVRASVHANDIYPGTYADVTVILPKTTTLVTIPQTALFKTTYGDYVYKVVGGKAKLTLVKVASRRGDIVGITKGLKANETVVSANLIKVRNGIAVTNKGAIKLDTKHLIKGS